ncbi:NLI interacting factor-like phosphatase [Rhizoctonia solani]|uniref:Mitochondrial import inner membrane translocase subunit TIM50 n=1 Tax=Rhizoctonia solani TaxID=456999 RepID=A0A8H8P061_9AGAM|nr:NLI interacting factor-like phosphatase [Rhizoctonia solani]QRW22780.1 NLI interacting factor-like phosphatase [Rhizoctonia solani]
MSGSGYIRFLHNTAGMATVNSYTRRPQRYRKPPPEFVPLPPSAEYLALSEIPSVPLLSDSDKPESRKLLVLDLNGTLVLRSPRSYSGPRTVMPRPFSKTFKEYMFREGSHLDVMVWSSAQPHSVHSMLGSFFGPDRNRLVGIWARDTLGLRPEHYTQKVQTIKDLDIIWGAPPGLPPPVKIMPPPPMAILTDDPTSIPGYDPSKPPPESKTMIYTSLQLMPESVQENSETDRTGYFEIPEVKKDDPIPGLSSIDPDAGAVQPVLPVGPYSALNSLLLDDSALKAHLQPYNHLTLPEYTADLRARDVRRQEAIEALANAETMTLETGIDEDSKESDGLIEKGGRDMGGKFTESEGEYLPILARTPYDKSLLAVIGVLDAIRYESSLVGWMKAGGMRPNEEEMQKVAALFLQDNQDRRGDSDGRLQDTGYDRDQATLQAIPIKRSSDSLIGAEQSSPKDLAPIYRERIRLLRPQQSRPRTQKYRGRSCRHFHDSLSTDEAPTSQPSKRRRHRTRQKPTYPIDHPLSANDPYPFFTDGKPETKLWFQDRDTYTYWVRRGLLALKECKIEPEAGVEVDI